MTVPGSLAQRIYLLAYDPGKGRVGVFTELGAMVRAAALADLYLKGHLADVRGRATITGRATAEGHPAVNGKPAVSSKPPFNGKPAVSGHSAAGSKSALSGRPAAGGKPALGGRPAGSSRPPANDRSAVGGRPVFGDPVLAGLIEEIAASKPRKWQHWIDKRQRPTVATVRRQLAEGGWVRLESYKIVGLIPATKVTLRNPRVRKELVSRVREALRAPVGRVDPADGALVTIVAAGKLDIVLDRKARRDSKRRLQDLADLNGPIGPALHKSIQASASGSEGGG
ncbi:GOLPH3/VPS74 family protein [Actinoplanes derwentensis]|uniref:Golgi phosphoprotein 3 (GPP34) n=1 Tax=Actinoplanes derwentensis TaxID=113562 RepID=A0A1H1RNS6_9ACTN|nr:GPP34 family phosphoprotein [Actinoplanes derwentensis]GID84479.1 hypothetical protein Ade03nite_34030 [Actinoplanes derwentensis]SDS37348.1 Golgi phosphoprotein 3 (GPP34) [Actinoplanes derwentensis]